MFFPFMDVQKQTFQIRNGGGQIFTAPYKCMVVLSDVKMDDSAFWQIQILDLEVVQGGAPNNMRFAEYGNVSVGGNTFLSQDIGSAYIMRSGQRLAIDAADDFDVTINYFRMAP